MQKITFKDFILIPLKDYIYNVIYLWKYNITAKLKSLHWEMIISIIYTSLCLIT